MKDASKTLKADIKKINIDKVEDMTDDMADMMEDMNEINDIMGRSYKWVHRYLLFIYLVEIVPQVFVVSSGFFSLSLCPPLYPRACEKQCRGRA